MTDDAVADLAPTGTIRAAINTGNPTLAHQSPDGSLGGRSVEMARAIAARLGRPLELLRYGSAGAVVEAAGTRAWDLAFLAVDPTRAQTLHFSPPYMVIEATYAVPLDSSIGSPGDVDRTGVRIASSKGAAYHLHLQRILKHARLFACETPPESFALLADGRADCAAGVRAALDRFFAGRPGFRILAENLVTVEQAVVTHRGRIAGAEFLDRFVAELDA